MTERHYSRLQQFGYDQTLGSCAFRAAREFARGFLLSSNVLVEIVSFLEVQAN